ncbi:MAG: tetratricopeptide repeat protein [Planctomycetes bacterium]|nr:tetratricopeptide repeat protein [Planctomycetota bacterium]
MTRLSRAALAVFIALALAAALRPTPAHADDKPEYTGVAACNKALALLKENKPKDALKVLEDAKDTIDDEDKWLWWGNSGLCHRDLREDDEALKCYEQAVKLKPDCWFVLRYAEMLHLFGRWDDALEQLDAEIARGGSSQRTEEFRNVILGPWRERWPHAWKKLEMTSKLGNYHVVSDYGVTEDEMDELEKQLTELDPEDRHDAKKIEKLLKPADDLGQLCDLMEYVRQRYMSFVGMKERDWPKGRVIKVFFFRTEQGFNDFSAMTGGEGSEHVAGFYDPNHYYLQLFGGQGGRRVYGIDEESLDTLIHEGWHQFFHVLAENVPTWLNEGLAEFLGKFELKQGGKSIELGTLVRARKDNYTRYEDIRTAIREGKYIPIKEFLHLTRDKWDAKDLDVAYAEAWSLAYYALKGNNSAFKKNYIKLFWGCVEGKNWQDLVDELFDEKDYEPLQAAWLKYMQNL